MPRSALPWLLAAAIALTPTRAHAGSFDDLVKAFVVIVVAGAIVFGTAETLTAVATYKNYRAASRNENPSSGWVGVGAVGGLINLGVGGYTFIDSLPGEREAPCPSEPHLPARPSGTPGYCLYRVPASTGGLVSGALFAGFGAFALGSAIAAARSGPGDAPAATSSPGAAPATFGLALPPLRF